MANRVIAGDYVGSTVTLDRNGLSVYSFTEKRGSKLDHETIAGYELVDASSRKSATSAVGRAFVGGALLGPAGLMAGLSAKSKKTHVVAVTFKDGCRSLLELDDLVYRTLVRIIF